MLITRFPKAIPVQATTITAPPWKIEVPSWQCSLWKLDTQRDARIATTPKHRRDTNLVSASDGKVGIRISIKTHDQGASVFHSAALDTEYRVYSGLSR